MQTLLGTEFTALLARAGVSQATFARLSGTTARQVNNWCRARAAVPAWAEAAKVPPAYAGGKLPEGAALAVLLQETSPEAIQILLEELPFSWHETLGVPPNAEAGTIRSAWARLALTYHPDQGGTQAQMARINEAYGNSRAGPIEQVRRGC